MERRRRSRRTSGHIVRRGKRLVKQITLIWIIKAVLYGFGIYSFSYCQREYAVTLISFQTVVTTGIITGLVASIIIERELKYYLFSIILLGSLCTGILFKLNRTFQHAQEIRLKPRILAKAIQSAKIEKSRVTIEYEDFNKDIPVDYIQEYLIGPSQFIALTVHKGGLGYYIITYHELVK
jgi:hypothetical protein